MKINFITISKFAELTGYSEDAIRSKISRGDWREDLVWTRAPDHRRLISVDGYDQWAEGQGGNHNG